MDYKACIVPAPRPVQVQILGSDMVGHSWELRGLEERDSRQVRRARLGNVCLRDCRRRR